MNTTVARIVFAALAGTFCSCLLLVLNNNLFVSIYRNIISVFIIIFIIYYKKIYLLPGKVISLFAIWYFNAFAMGGVFGYLINGRITTIILMRIATALIVVMYIFAGRNRINKIRDSNENTYKITIVKGENTVNGFGYYDSGCKVYEPISGKMAVITSYSTIYSILTEGERTYIDIFPMLPDEWDGMTHIRSIPYSTIDNNRGIIPAVRVDEIIIEKRNSKKSYSQCYVAVCKNKITKDKSFEYILHCNMKLGG